MRGLKLTLYGQRCKLFDFFLGCQRCHWTVTKVVTFLILFYPVVLDYVFDDVVANYLSISSTNLEKKREK